MHRTYCFVGPSLPDAARLAAGSDIEILPPVAAVDLLRLDTRAGDTVGIVDGYFHQTGSVRHKEILALLARGVRVLGAASMGALRAAELDRFGMEGVGAVYAGYRDGRLEADDEVTLLHSPPEDDYRAHSEPLVCIRATLAEAVRRGVCDASIAGRIVAVLAGLPYGLRSYEILPRLGTETGVPAGPLEELRRWCTAHRQDPKRADALLLLERLRSPSDTAGPNPPVVHRTSLLCAWQLAARGSATDGRPKRMGLVELRACKLFAPDFPARYRELVLRGYAEDCARECGESPAGTDAERAVRHGAHRGLYRLPADRARLGFLDQWLTPAEARLPLTDQLAAFLVRSCRDTLVLPWDERALDGFAERTMLASADRFVRLAREVNRLTLEGRPDLGLDSLSEDRVRRQLAARWSVPRPELGVAALDRGFSSLDSAVAAARFFYLFVRYNERAAHWSPDDPSSAAVTGEPAPPSRP
ncbi:TfuA-like protein [Streptomyces bauhiniae]